ncbi:hypothetical protein [Paractinoplanes rishiriensis]|uniref:Uncharacterized protein n=1 Tax=Paractinoplanes rishiriensis TaxID=1050105 RepID=A0A919MW45_9ACTN|nr:hypothetical protein [Actinoplanes rishiriensis]GIF02097.1 hypothetical protein Ari01nite_95610 [Actinoplanes rishiriensis]
MAVTAAAAVIAPALDSGHRAVLAVTMPLWHPGQALPVTIAIGLVSGLLMAAIMAAITGLAVVRLADDRALGRFVAE